MTVNQKQFSNVVLQSGNDSHSCSSSSEKCINVTILNFQYAKTIQVFYLQRITLLHLAAACTAHCSFHLLDIHMFSKTVTLNNKGVT